MFDSPFPKHVAFAAEHSAIVEDQKPHDEELAALGDRATANRKRAFILGRLAANKALKSIIDNPPPVLRAPDRAPRWPEGVVGSITHAAEWGLAAVDLRWRTRAIGIDLAHLSELHDVKITQIVANIEEQQWIAGDLRRLLALFSAKESAFKALYPECQVYFGFHDATARWSEMPTPGFEIQLLRQLSPSWPSGSIIRVGVRWYNEFVLTSAWLPSESKLCESM